MRRFDLVVAGAGLAGLQTARLLAERGLRVALVDRKRSPDQVVQTTAIFVRRTIEDFSLPSSLLGVPIRSVTLRSPDGSAATFESPHDEFRIARMKLLYRHYFLAAVSAGCEWIGATTFVRSEPGLVHLSTRGRGWILATRFVIGADGACSRVARDLGLHRNSEWIVGVEEVRRSNGRGAPRMECFLDPKRAPGYIGWVVDDGEEVHAGVGGYPHRFRPAEALADFLRTAGVEGERIETRGGCIPVGGIGRRIACERGLLVGDAAGAASPLTAGGLDAALRLSSFAASVAARYLESGSPEALRGYSGGRFRTRFVSRIWMRRLFAAIGSESMMNAAVRVLTLPGASMIGRHVFFGRGSFPLTMQEIDGWAGASG